MYKPDKPIQQNPPIWTRYLKVDDSYPHISGDGSDQLVVYRKNPNDDVEFDNWILRMQEKIKGKNGNPEEIRIVSACGTCGGSLFLFIGKGISIYISTEAVPTGNQQNRTKVMEGSSGGIYYSSNLKMYSPESKRKEFVRGSGDGGKYSLPDTKLPVIKVAVFDTGLLPGEVDPFLINPVPNPCIMGGGQGWNFTGPNSNYNDDNRSAHGSTVTRFIIDQVLKENGNRVQILPVKVHDCAGVSDLYSVLCGFAYAKNLGAHIINASFGYYAPLNATKEYGIELFKNFVIDQLTNNGILLIAAAGNEATPYEIETKDFRNLQTAPDNDDHRNLDMIGFYPASFAADLSNVIAVTTVHRDGQTVSANQNFSKRVVDVGVKADESQPGEYGFENPRTTMPAYVYGSSFATPKLTGLIAANYSRFKLPLKKADIIKLLEENRKLEKQPALSGKIKLGMVL